MLTRRAILAGTAGASIAAIAGAHGIAAAPESAALDLGFGNLDGGALAAFSKRSYGFGLFVKWQGAGAEIFYKEIDPGTVAVFAKHFVKGWTPVANVYLNTTLADTVGSFNKVHLNGADFFIKNKDGITNILTRFKVGEDGVQIESVVPDSD